MKTRTALRALLLFSLVLMAVMTNTDQSNAWQQQSSKLLALIGQKCTVTLNTGEVVAGTLWDYGDDFVSLKVKKGPLFSKTLKYAFSEIKYVDDEFGNRIDFNGSTGQTSEADTQPTRIFFSTDDTQPAAETKPATESATHSQQPVRETRQKEEVRVRQTNQPAATGAVRSEQNTRVKPEQQQNSGVSSETQSSPQPVPVSSRAQQREATVSQPAASPAKPAAGNKVAKAAKERQNSQQVKPQKTPKVATTEIDTPMEQYKRMRILRYQTLVLFCVLILIAGVMLISKVAGMKGSAYGKYSLFPSKLVKMNGRFGVIDQGHEDGVKKDDIIRLYGKTGQKVVYHGKVQVKKVAENYSAVEIVRKQAGVRMGVGDVGFRERNFVYNFYKRLRILTSAGLNSIGKGLVYTAQNIKVKEVEPKIDIGQDQDQATTRAQKKAESKVRSKSSASQKKTASSGVKSGTKPKPGFGIE